MTTINTRVMTGFMELLPQDQICFNHMLDTIRKSYEQFGFIPLDTPVIERAEVLFTKAGQETEKQIYRIDKGETPQALRFDLTVPLARYVSHHFNDLTFPFKRYHIGKVYRGERPQKGRYREFYQCDIDIIGNESLGLVNDAEVVSVINTTFKKLALGDFTIRINNRKILSGFFAHAGLSEKITDILRIIDKLEKIGKEKVIEELQALGITTPQAHHIIDFASLKGAAETVIPSLRMMNIQNDLFLLGLSELEQVVQHLQELGVQPHNFCIDLSIARGLDYYTGTVFETMLNALPHIGSVCSGGRYDNLAESFSNKKLPGVGISIGLTRLFSQLKEHNMLPHSTPTIAEVLIIPLTQTVAYALDTATTLRNHGHNVQVYLEQAKPKKKIEYAHKLGIPFVIFIGDDEIAAQTYTIKNMHTGEQTTLKKEQLTPFFTKN
ncbi:MAG: Histidine-tRNA ligase [candidate division TM6 bacterium GW2011_GWF2_36_6]|nr:MAG: Histidine-tRNA ligase [candidate division TM6 bacterium GW2011_GWF2_36_6]